MTTTKINIIIQVVLWSFFLSIVAIMISIFKGTDLLPDPNGLVTWGVLLNHILFGSLIVYVNYFLIFPLLIKKQYQRYCFILLSYLLLMSFLRVNTEEWFGIYISERFHVHRILIFSAQLLAMVGISTAYGIVQHWLKTMARENQLKQEKLASELKFLKSQINPHFLFNTLNNIYSLAYRQSQEAAPMVAKLSKIMRYILYDCSESQVPLQKEAQLLQDYIELHQLKNGETMNVDLYAEGLSPHHRIAPMLLINFIENSFKHSDIATNAKAWINISMIVEDNMLHFHVENTAKTNQLPSEKGVGNKNTLRQLSLNYPDRHELSVQQKDGIYEVDLKLQL